jgi:ankyrin repeat protein
MRDRNCNESQGRLLKQVINYTQDGPEPETTPLHEAASQGWGIEEAVEALEIQSHTADALNTPDETGYTALHVALLKRHHECARVLIEAGADVNRQAANGFTPLMLAIAHQDIEMMRLLLLRGDSCSKTDRRERCHANEKNRNGRTALHVAAVSCNPEAVQLLLDEGASASERDSYGYTPLHYVALQVGSDSNGISQVGCILELLLGAGRADINAIDFYGQPPLMLAVARNRLAVTQHLINAGASHTSVTTKSENLLHHAAFYSSLDMLQLLHHLDLSRISVRLHDIGGDNPWDVFKRRLYRPAEHELHGCRLTKEEGDAFVNLFRGIRDRNIKDDCSLLTQVLDSLSSDNPAASCRHLSILIENKETCGELGPAGFYSGIKGNINAGDYETAIKCIEEDLHDLRDELTTDPWDQTSRWDSLGPLVFR